MKLICTQGYKNIYEKGKIYKFAGLAVIGDDGGDYSPMVSMTVTKVPFRDGMAIFKPLTSDKIDGCPGLTYSYDDEDCCISFYANGEEVTCWTVDDYDFIDGMVEDLRKIYKLGQAAGQ